MPSVETAFEQVVELDTGGNILRRWAGYRKEAGMEWHPCEVSQPLGEGVSPLCIAIVPGTDVLVTQIDLPVRRRSDLREKAAAYALEDRLAADIETLHFAVTDAGDKTSKAEVVVVAKEDLHRWQQALMSANLEAISIVPDTALIPRPTSGARLHVGATRCWLVEATGDAMAFEPELWDAGVLPPEASALYVSYEAEIGQDLADQIVEKARQQGIDVTGPVAASLLERLDQSHGCELLAGRYARDFDWEGLIRRFRAPLILAAVAATLYVVTLALEVRALTEEASRLEKAVEARFEQLLPDTEMVAPRRQIQNQLTNMGLNSQAGASSSPVPLLNHLGEALADQPGMEVLNVTYRPGRLDAELRTQSLQSFSALTSSLPTESLEVDLRQASTGGSGTVGQIRLQELTP